MEEFASKLQNRIAHSEDLTYVRSDKYTLLGELLSTPELEECLRLVGLDGSGVRFDKARGKAKLSPDINNFIEQMVETSTLPDGQKLFDYWADTGVGSWIRLAQSGKRQWSQYHRSSNGNGSLQHGARSGSDSMRPPPPQITEAKAPASSLSGSRALPGWVTRAQSAPDSKAPPVPPAARAAPEGYVPSDVPSSANFLAPSEPAEVPGKAEWPPPPPSVAIKRNKASNKMKMDSHGPELAQEPAPTPKPPPAELLRQVAPPPSPVPAPPPLAQEPAVSWVPKAPPPLSNEEPPLAPECPKGEEAEAPSSPRPPPWELPEQIARTTWLRGVLRSYHPDQAFGLLAIAGRGEPILVRASAFEGEIPQELDAGWHVEVESEEVENETRVLRARVLAAPQASRKDNNVPGGGPATKHRGRLKTFMLEKGFGFCQLEDPERTMDVFLHINSFEGQKPDDFSGLPGLPPVGQEVELKLADNTVRPRATWARIVGPALPVDKSKVLSNCLSHVLKSPERFLEGKQQKAGWYKLVDVLATDQLRPAVTAFSSSGTAEINRGSIPEPLMNSLHDLAVCVVAPTPEAAGEAIAGSTPSTAQTCDTSPKFHLWLEQEAFLGENSSPEAERLWLRPAQRPARGFQATRPRMEKEKSWWEGGGSASRPEPWEPQHLKALCSNPMGDCTADDLLKVLGALPVDAPSEVRRYLEAWEKRMRLK